MALWFVSTKPRPYQGIRWPGLRAKVVEGTKLPTNATIVKDGIANLNKLAKQKNYEHHKQAFRERDGVRGQSPKPLGDLSDFPPK